MKISSKSLISEYGGLATTASKPPLGLNCTSCPPGLLGAKNTSGNSSSQWKKRLSSAPGREFAAMSVAGYDVSLSVIFGALSQVLDSLSFRNRRRLSAFLVAYRLVLNQREVYTSYHQPSLGVISSEVPQPSLSITICTGKATIEG